MGCSRSSSRPFRALYTFEIPLPLPAVEVGFAWRPRHDADAAHARLRGCVRELMNEVSAG
ncbi:hypothetical protein [Streptomyces sp. NPDC001307]|uniref:hypothetical protein n=1 Tax=Streptomyces sp. NPDC001307 TaxID=3364560 RepID=UPI003676DE41